MERVCFRTRINPEMRDEYIRRHQAVWPEMTEALAATGWHNYTLFIDDEGTVFGYFETPDLEVAFAGMAALDINSRWQAEMAPFFPDANGRRPDEGFQLIPALVHLTPPAPVRAATGAAQPERDDLR